MIDRGTVRNMSVLILLSSCITYTIAVCTVEKPPDDGHRNCPKHKEFYSRNKFGEISASGWYYYKNLYTSFPEFFFSVPHQLFCFPIYI